MQAVAGAASPTFFAELYFLVMNLQITATRTIKTIAQENLKQP